MRIILDRPLTISCACPLPERHYQEDTGVGGGARGVQAGRLHSLLATWLTLLFPAQSHIGGCDGTSCYSSRECLERSSNTLESLADLERNISVIEIRPSYSISGLSSLCMSGQMDGMLTWCPRNCPFLTHFPIEGVPLSNTFLCHNNEHATIA